MRKPKAQRAPPRRRTYSDPLTAALVPPPNETVTERELRLKAELDAKKVSDSIDDMLHQERSESKKLKPEVTVLLLGQSESGKSTTLKRKSRRSGHKLSLTAYFYQNSSYCTLPPHSTQKE
jgi:guanine nucleotide-binding protein subunit alpha